MGDDMTSGKFIRLSKRELDNSSRHNHFSHAMSDEYLGETANVNSVVKDTGS